MPSSRAAGRVSAPEPAPWTGDWELPRPRGSTHGSAKLSPSQIAEATELLRSGSSFPKLAKRYGCSVSTLRSYVDVGPLRSKNRYPTEPVHYAFGVVHWERPLIRGRRVKVVVECRCGRERLIGAHRCAFSDRTFTAECAECRSKYFPSPALPRRSPLSIQHDTQK